MENQSGKIHFIAIGGSVMHQLAIALKKAGYDVSGSDDQIFDPSKSNLAKEGLLPAEEGWFPEKLTGIDMVIAGMHARDDNPELKKARELNIKIYSFPDFIYEQSKDKQRVVISGSHGKTTITSMIIHVLNYYNRDFDYVVGAEVPGFENQVRLSDAPVIVIEGDEYPSSPLDPEPKFLKYNHHIALVSGISWDHINAFPTEEEYVEQFEQFLDSTPKGGVIIYNDEDSLTSMIGGKFRLDVINIDYKTHPYTIKDGKTFLLNGKAEIPVQVFGKHNMQNLSGAKAVLNRFALTDEYFYKAIQSFQGTKNRLEPIIENENFILYKDYAHAPSKVQSTIKAVKEKFPDRKVIACLELHTFSSLNAAYLTQYKGSMEEADLAIVYFNPETVKHKKLQPISREQILSNFNREDIEVFTDANELKDSLLKKDMTNLCLLIMSSGDFGGIEFEKLF